MLFRALALIAAIVAMPSVASADARSESKSQVEFGIKVAQNGLWKEATYRWEKAVQLDPPMRRPGTISRSATSTTDVSKTQTTRTRRRSSWIRKTSRSAPTTISSKKSMTARNVAAIASLALVCASGCTNLYEVPVETPIQAKLDVA